MKTATVRLKSMSPYSQARFYEAETPYLEKESKDDYAARTWRMRAHANKDGNIIIPPMAFKNCLSESAKFLSLQIPGKGKSTYTKHFEAGVLVTDELVLPNKRDEVDGETFFVPSDGVRGSGKRVLKTFPVIREWSGVVDFFIFDETVTEKVFHRVIEQAGQFIGIGRFRPRNNGYYGRFSIESIQWK